MKTPSKGQSSVIPFKGKPPGIYHVGDRDERPWGHYVVTGAGIAPNGEEFCEKTITVKPGQVLSLQAHSMRRETWTVKSGILTAVRDSERVEVLPRQSIFIPVGSIHCMANLGETDCVVEERQEGVCREEDIKRYMDAYNRNTEILASPTARDSFAIYQGILDEIKDITEKRKQEFAG